MSWKVVSLIEIAAKSKYPIGDGDHGAIKPSQYQRSGIPYIRVADMDWSGEIIEDYMAFISEEINTSNPKSHLFPGDIIISKTGATIGKVAIIPDRFKIANTTASIGKVTIDKTLADIRYVFWAMKSQDFQKEMWKVSHKSAQPGFNVDDLKKFKIPLPPLATQKRIAEILDAADALRRKDQELLKKYDELAQAIFIDMFGDPVKNEKGWEEIFLKDICLKITDGTHQSPKFTNEGVPFLFVSNIVKNKISYETSTFISEEEFDILNKRTPIEVGNILITTVGSYGNPAVIENNLPFAFQRHIAFLKPNHSLINYYFLFGFLKSPAAKNQIDRKVNGVAQKTLNLSDLKDLKIWNVPRSLQDNYSEILKKLQLQFNLSETDRSNLLFNSLIQKAFNGEFV